MKRKNFKEGSGNLPWFGNGQILFLLKNSFIYSINTHGLLSPFRGRAGYGGYNHEQKRVWDLPFEIPKLAGKTDSNEIPLKYRTSAVTNANE